MNPVHTVHYTNWDSVGTALVTGVTMLHKVPLSLQSVFDALKCYASKSVKLQSYTVLMRVWVKVRKHMRACGHSHMCH